MKTGVIVEGNGEISAFEKLIPKICAICPHEIIHRPLRADLQPKANNAAVIAQSAKVAVELFVKRGVKKIIVLIDAEDHACPARLAQSLTAAFEKMYSKHQIRFNVVAKNRMIENWLISDTAAFEKIPGRFKVDAAFTKAVSPNKADSNIAPVNLLNKIVVKDQYEKGSDPTKIMSHQDPLRMAKNSRSFRRFLRVVDCTPYANQSKQPL